MLYRLRTFSPSPVPQGLPRFTSRGTAHTFKEASPPYLQPTLSFIDGAKPTILDHVVPKATAVETPPKSARPFRRTGPSTLHEKSLQATPLRMPTDKSSLGTTVKETETQGSD